MPYDDEMDDDEVTIGGVKLKLSNLRPPSPGGPDDATAAPSGGQIPAALRGLIGGANLREPSRPLDDARNAYASALPADTSTAPDVAMPQGNAVIRNLAKPTNQMPPAPPPSQATGLIEQRAERAKPLDPTQDQYRMGWGQRILGTLSNAARGFGGSHDNPIYVGPGATNRRFDVDTGRQAQDVSRLDTQIGATQKNEDEMRKQYADAVKAAYEGQLADIKGEHEKTYSQFRTQDEANKAELNRIREENNKLKNDRDIIYDPATKRFTKDGKPYTPKNIEEGAAAEAAANAEGRYSKMWGSERKNQPININTGRKLSAKDEGRVTAYERQSNKSRDEFSTDDWDAALGRKPAGPAHTKDRETFERHWGERFKRESDSPFERERSAVVKRSGIPDITKNSAAWKNLGDDDRADITKSLSDIEQRRAQKNAELQGEKDKEAEQYGVYGGSGANNIARNSVAPGSTQAQRKVGDVVPMGGRQMRITKVLPNGKYEGVPAQ